MCIIKKFNLALIYLIPFFLIFAHSFADGVVVLTGIIFLILLLLRKLPVRIADITKDKVIISFFLFYIILVISSFFAEFQSLSLKRSIPYIRFIFFIAALKYWLFVDRDSIKILIYSILVCLIFVCLDVIFQYFNYKYVEETTPLNYFNYKSDILFFNAVLDNSSDNFLKKGFDIFGYASKNYYRFQGPFGDEFIAGGFILRFSPFLFLTIFGIYRLKKDKFSKILIFLSAILIIFSILITGDRAPFFILIIVTSLLFLIFLKKKDILIIFTFLLVIIFLLGSNLDKKQRYINEALITIGFQNNKFSLDTGYGHLFYSAIKIWMDKPLLGAGTKNYRKICARDQYNFKTNHNHELCSTHPHNYVLELLSEVGFIGLLSFYLIFFYLLRELNSFKKTFQKNLDNLKIKFTTVSLILILWPLSTTGSIITNFNSIVLWLVFGMAYSSIAIKKTNL